MDGMFAGNYNDYNINRTGLSTEAIEDTQVKTGGVDASSPMGMSLVINMSSKSGGNQFHGSVGVDYQPLSWNDNNAPAGGSRRRFTRSTSPITRSEGPSGRIARGSSAPFASPTSSRAPAGRRRS
jgi:hypothetical protein